MNDNDGPREVYPVMMEHESPIPDFRPSIEKIDPEADPKDWSAPELAEPSDEPDADLERLFPELALDPEEEELPPPTPVLPEPPASVEKELPKAPKVVVGKSTS